GGAAADPRDAVAPRAARARASLRPGRAASAHARRGRQDVQRHPRADPPDRESEPEEAPRAGRGGQAARGRVAPPATAGTGAASVRAAIGSTAVEQAWLDELSELLRIPSISADTAHAADVAAAADWVAGKIRRGG